MSGIVCSQVESQPNSDWLAEFGQVRDTESIRQDVNISIKKFTTARISERNLLPEPNNEFAKTPSTATIDWRSSLNDFSTTEELMREISDVQFCWMNLLVQGHMTVVCSKGNGGKTTIMVKACEDMVKSGYEIFYVNADASADQLKQYHTHATKHGYSLLAPDLHLGKSAEDVFNLLTEMSQADENYSGTILILDTMKKFVALMNKALIGRFNSILRALTAKGMTIICLAHTNKHNDKDGKPVFEGTGDVRNDFDELIYLISIKNEDGSLVVSTDADKIRASGIKNYTFDISPERIVTVRDQFEDTLTIHQMQASMEKDSKTIDFVFDSIKSHSKSIQEIQTEAKLQGIGISKDTIRRVVTRYSSDCSKTPLWRSIPTGKNGYRYVAFPGGGLFTSKTTHTSKVENIGSCKQ